jgi:hypothetical protein
MLDSSVMSPLSLQDLLNDYGITRPIELARAAQIARSDAWAIWHGRRRLGAIVALRLRDTRGVPVEPLLRAEAKPLATPRGRPRLHPVVPPSGRGRGRPRLHPQPVPSGRPRGRPKGRRDTGPRRSA